MKRHLITFCFVLIAISSAHAERFSKNGLTFEHNVGWTAQSKSFGVVLTPANGTVSESHIVVTSDTLASNVKDARVADLIDTLVNEAFTDARRSTEVVSVPNANAAASRSAYLIRDKGDSYRLHAYATVINNKMIVLLAKTHIRRLEGAKGRTAELIELFFNMNYQDQVSQQHAQAMSMIHNISASISKPQTSTTPIAESTFDQQSVSLPQSIYNIRNCK